MTLVKSDQDTLLNVREGVQILQRRMRFQQWYLIHKMVMMKAESDVFTTLLQQCPQPNLSQGFISAFRTLSAQIDGWQEQDCKAMSCRILQTDM